MILKIHSSSKGLFHIETHFIFIFIFVLLRSTHYDTVSQSINDWLDYKRIANEIEGIQETIVVEEEDLQSLKAEHSSVTKKNNTLKINCSELQQLQNVAKQFRNDAIKVSDKRHKISQSQNELSMMAPTANGKDLHTLERDLTKKSEDKDSLMNSITLNNKELSDLNNLISRASNQAQKAENAVREQEEKYAIEQKAILKKQELNATIMQRKEREGQVRLILRYLYPYVFMVRVETHGCLSVTFPNVLIAPRSNCPHTLEGESEGDREKPL